MYSELDIYKRVASMLFEDADIAVKNNDEAGFKDAKMDMSKFTVEQLTDTERSLFI